LRFSILLFALGHVFGEGGGSLAKVMAALLEENLRGVEGVLFSFKMREVTLSK
jgi:hypothetical protein